MASNYLIPDATSVSSVLTMLLGDGPQVTKAPAADLASCHVATYVDNTGKIVAACACDRSFVAYASAAFSMIPADVAEEIVKGSDMSDVVRGNFHEIMNIFSTILMSDKTAHLRLDKSLAPEMATDIIGSLADTTSSSFAVDIPRYGNGIVQFLIAA